MLFSLLSPAGKNARLSVFIFHRVLAVPDPLLPDVPTADRFDEILGWIKSWFNVLTLEDAVARLKCGSLPPRAAALTFDDGYADNYHVALPLLKKHNLNATLFVATAFIDGGIMWNDALIETVRRARSVELDFQDSALGKHHMETVADRQTAIRTLIHQIKDLDFQPRLNLVGRCVEKAGVTLPSNLMMTSDELRKWQQAGMAVGGHTVHHPILARVSEEEARKEIRVGKEQLEAILREPVQLFAYPNGSPGKDYLTEHVRMVREAGFRAAVSTVWGSADRRSDIYQLARFTPWDMSKLKFGLRLTRNILKST